MSGGWWCCCAQGCEIFLDEFDRVGDEDNPIITDILGGYWQVLSGDWWLGISTYPLYGSDGALYELSGNGTVLTAIEAGFSQYEFSQQVQLHTIDEHENQVYQLWLLVDAELQNGLLAELELGPNGPTGEPESITLRGITVQDGVRTVVGEKTNTAAHGASPDYEQVGRVFRSGYFHQWNLWCISVEPGTSRGEPLVCRGVSAPSLGHAGIGNGSGSTWIEVDNFEWNRLYQNHHDMLRYENPCYYCVCRCTDNREDPKVERLFPLTLNLRIQGSCCIPKYELVPGGCDDLSDCPQIDMDVALQYEDDVDHEFFDLWWAETVICDVTFRFLFYCDKNFQIFTWNPPNELYPGAWVLMQDVSWPDFPFVSDWFQPKEDWTCVPIYFRYEQVILVSSHPCCLSLPAQCQTEGHFTYTITENPDED